MQRQLFLLITLRTQMLALKVTLIHDEILSYYIYIYIVKIPLPDHIYSIFLAPLQQRRQQGYRQNRLGHHNVSSANFLPDFPKSMIVCITNRSFNHIATMIILPEQRSLYSILAWVETCFCLYVCDVTNSQPMSCVRSNVFFFHLMYVPLAALNGSHAFKIQRKKNTIWYSLKQQLVQFHIPCICLNFSENIKLDR